MNLKQLKYFATVAEEKQITAAAKRLDIAQPPLSYQLKQLEKELGVQLIQRTSHGIRLTPAGTTLEKYAHQILDLAKITEQKVKQVNDGYLGLLRIGMTSTSGGVIPNKSLPELTASYPNVRFEIQEGNTYELLDLLHQHLIDIAVVRTPFNTEELQVRYFDSESMVAVVPSAWQNEVVGLTSLNIEKLSHLPLIVYRRFKVIITDSFEHRGIQPFIAMECDDGRTCINWAQKNMGVALVPQTCAQSYADKGVKLIPIAHEAWKTQLALVWNKRKSIPSILKKFINCYKNDTIESEKG